MILLNWLLNELIHIKIVNMMYSTNIASTTWFNDERRRTMRYVDTDAAFLQLRETFELRPANANSLRFTKYTILSGLFLSANEANSSTDVIEKTHIISSKDREKQDSVTLSEGSGDLIQSMMDANSATGLMINNASLSSRLHKMFSSMYILEEVYSQMIWQREYKSKSHIIHQNTNLIDNADYRNKQSQSWTESVLWLKQFIRNFLIIIFAVLLFFFFFVHYLILLSINCWSLKIMRRY